MRIDGLDNEIESTKYNNCGLPCFLFVRIKRYALFVFVFLLLGPCGVLPFWENPCWVLPGKSLLGVVVLGKILAAFFVVFVFGCGGSV